MKRILFISFYIVINIIIFACNDEAINSPIASTQAKFSIEITNNGITPVQVIFINESVNALSYLWRFGNGDSLFTSSRDTVTYTYNQAGTYNISLTVESENPDLYYNTLVYQKTIVITSKPVKRLYFTDRIENKVKYIILDDNPFPVIEKFESATLDKPYGMDMDTANGKLFVMDYAEQILNRYDWNGNGHEILMNTNTENFDSPVGIVVVQNKIYWGDLGGIHCANLDGKDPQMYIPVPDEYPQDIAYDNQNQVFYFTNNLNPESGGVWKVNFDGTNLTEIVPDVWGGAIEVDPDNNRLYFYAGNEGMYLCDLEGNNRILFDSTNAEKWAWGMAIDKENGKIYYPNRVHMTIMKADLDGSNVETFIPVSANINPNAMTIDTYR